MKAYIEQLMDYNYWANGLILKYAEQLDPENFAQKTADSQAGVQENLIHIMFAEKLWLDRMSGKSRSQKDYDAQYNPRTYAEIRKIYEDWFDLELKMRAFIDSLDGDQLLKSFRYTRLSTGDEHENRLIDILTQLVFHGMQHRAEIAQALTGFGHSPGNIDYLTYLRP